MTEHITSDDWQAKVLDAAEPVLVDFYAEWCGPCKGMAPIIDEIAVEKAGSASVYKIDIDENMEIAQRYKVMSIPTFIVFKGGEPAKTWVGACSKAEILDMFA